jgi:hypothetical protein
MKANELRIGNWVRQRESDTYIQIEQYLLCNEELCHYQPIPLTEDWLFKFDFISNPYEDRYEKVPIHVECLKSKGATYLWIENMPHIKYVHQLQNLYFALTGEELTYERESNESK